MTIKAGDKLPEGKVLVMGENGPEQKNLSDLTRGRVAIFGVPGAFTPTCTNSHMPSFVRSADQFRAKGIDRIMCITVNDPFVAAAWARDTGADKAGIEVLADADGSLVQAMGLAFDAAPAGLIGRSKRFAALATDGILDVVEIEDNAGQCSITGGNSLLEKV